jgi:hypothetical protein
MGQCLKSAGAGRKFAECSAVMQLDRGPAREIPRIINLLYITASVRDIYPGPHLIAILSLFCAVDR